MSQRWPPQQPPPNAPAGTSSAGATTPRTWTVPASLVSALLACSALGVGIYFLVASHGTTAGCLVDQGMRTAAILTAPVGGFLSILALAAGFVGVFGARRTSGAQRVIGILGLVLGLIALFACAGLWLAATTGGTANPRYLHPC